jgi:hypothetical protein
MSDGFEDRVKVSGEFGMVARDLPLPDPGEQNHLPAILVDRDGQRGFRVGDASQAAARLGRL